MDMNFTPIRTSKNYGINEVNINLNNIKTTNLSKNNKNSVQNIDIFKNFVLPNNPNVQYENFLKIENENYLSDEILEQTKKFSNANFNATILNSTDTLRFCFNFDEQNSELIGVFNLTIKEDVKTKIVFEFNGNSNNNYQNLNIKINLEKNAEANIIVYSELGEFSSNLISIQTDLQKNAKLDINFIDIACKNSIFNYKSKILGENSESNLNSLYLGDKDSTIDLNYLIEVFAPNSKTNMEVLGTISGNAKKHFKGTIDFKKGCKKSVGAENEYCMLLSKNTRSKALPMILCTEEDVDGKHSSSVGKVDEKQLFYIMSRGLSQSEATRLVVKAKFNKIITSLFDEELKTKILETIDRKIN